MTMPDTKTVDPLLVAKIVRNYVSHNGIPSDELPDLIASVHRSLAALGQPPETPLSRKPAIAINRSYRQDFVACLDCGWRGQMLRRHLMTAHGLLPDDYRARWNLKNNHPLTAPGYSKRRSALAKQFGLGHAPSAAAGIDPAFDKQVPQPERRGRTSGTAPTETTP